MDKQQLKEVRVKMKKGNQVPVAGANYQAEVLVMAPGAFSIIGADATLVCTMHFPGGVEERRWKTNVYLPDRKTDVYAKLVRFSSNEPIDYPTYHGKRTSISWHIETKISLTHQPPQKAGKRRQAQKTVIKEDNLPIEIKRGSAKKSVTYFQLFREDNVVYFWFALSALAFFLPLSWGWYIPAIAALILSLFGLERAISRKHLMQGLSIDMTRGPKRRLAFVFKSVTDNRDFLNGVLTLRLEERYSNLKRIPSDVVKKGGATPFIAKLTSCVMP